MSTIWTLLRATAVVAGASAALLTGGLMGTAHADPAAPVPAPNIGQQLAAGAAGAPQVLQNLATAVGAQPPAPPPLASIRVPQPSAAAVPGATSAVPGATSLFPGAAPRATTTTPGLGIPGLTPTVPAPASPAPGLSGIPGLTPTVPAAAAPVAGHREEHRVRRCHRRGGRDGHQSGRADSGRSRDPTGHQRGQVAGQRNLLRQRHWQEWHLRQVQLRLG